MALSIDEIRVARLYFLGKKMTRKDMELFRESAKRELSKKDFNDFRRRRANLMQRKRVMRNKISSEVKKVRKMM